MIIITTFIGFAILTMGRQLFWIFLAGMGFILGIVYASQFYSGQPEWVIIAIGAAVGALGALLAVTIQKLAAGLAGFLAGWYLTPLGLSYLGLELGNFEQIAPILGGAIGAVLILAVFEWSLMSLSSLAGAGIIVNNLRFPQNTEIAMFIILAVLGLVIQAILYYQEQHREV
ncbi:MAG: hypothetical protein JW862_13780 [Anaerolineales bacterium]|nr:hypothetical protein [Anaerolineales bacterium]